MKLIKFCFPQTSTLVPNVSELINALKSCLFDANKNLVIRAVMIIGTIAEACGKNNTMKFARGLLPELPAVLADKKITVVQAVLATYTQFLLTTSHQEMVILSLKGAGD